MKINLTCLIAGTLFQSGAWWISATAINVQERNFATFIGAFALLLTICGIVCVFEDTSTRSMKSTRSVKSKNINQINK
jgi:hypothetical protein